MLHHIQIVAPIIYKCSSREKQDLVEPIFIAMLRNFQMWFIVLAQNLAVFFFNWTYSLTKMSLEK